VRCLPLVALTLAAAGSLACGQPGARGVPADAGPSDARSDARVRDAGARDANVRDAVEDAPAIVAQAGFTEIEPIHFVEDGARHVSEIGRLWYAFQPATNDPAHGPLFVFFNGGPGSSTSEDLFAGNTAKDSEDPYFTNDAAIGPSPRPWTALGNLLYIDARETGFSYDVIGDPADAEAREAGYSDNTFTSAFDAADFVRVILRFLAAHPVLLGNPVVIVGESYGGVRAAGLIHDVLHSPQLRDKASSYVDSALADEIDRHFAATIPGLVGAASPSQAAKQFGRQVLIEPIVAGVAQYEVAAQLLNEPGSPLYVLGKAIGRPYVPCDCGAECGTPQDCQRAFVWDAGRTPYDIDLTAASQVTRQAAIEASLSTISTLSAALGVPVESIPLLPAKQRAGAYRAITLTDLPWTPTDESDLRTKLGQPAPWDWYLLGANPAVLFGTPMKDEGREQNWGAYFLADLPYVKTFITHGMLDVIVDSLSIPSCLAKAYPSTVTSVDVDTKPRTGVARPGWFTVHYATDALDGGVPIPPQTVRFPVYANAGHHVASCEPVEFEEDVAAWLAEP
jgi:hypothetical protein